MALTICQTVDGRILVGTYGNGVYQVNSDGTSIPAYSVSNGKLKSDYVYSLFTDSQGNLWIGCLDGDMACFPSGKNISEEWGRLLSICLSTRYNALPNQRISAVSQ